MSGCDYLNNLKGLGFGSLLKFFHDHRSKSEEDFEEALSQKVRKRYGKVGADYLKQVELIHSYFTNQIVYNRTKKQLVYSTKPVKDHAEVENYVGQMFDNYEAFVRGDLDFETKRVRPETEQDIRKIISFIRLNSTESVRSISNLCGG